MVRVDKAEARVRDAGGWPRAVPESKVGLAPGKGIGVSGALTEWACEMIC